MKLTKFELVKFEAKQQYAKKKRYPEYMADESLKVLRKLQDKK